MYVHTDYEIAVKVLTCIHKAHHKLGAPPGYILLEFELNHVLLPDKVEGSMEPGNATATHPLLHEC